MRPKKNKIVFKRKSVTTPNKEELVKVIKNVFKGDERLEKNEKMTLVLEELLQNLMQNQPVECNEKEFANNIIK